LIGGTTRDARAASGKQRRRCNKHKLPHFVIPPYIPGG
jgi:hypothetical protein